eukprot:149824-Chlamydomonas_euryale.AAC.2
MQALQPSSPTPPRPLTLPGRPDAPHVWQVSEVVHHMQVLDIHSERRGLGLGAAARSLLHPR